jgi:acyl dehydratase
MYFEEFQIGTEYETPWKTIEAKEVDAFVALSGLKLPMFLSDQGAARMGRSRRLVPGPMILAVAMGLVFEAGLFDHVVAVARFDRLEFLRPVYPGDRIQIRVRVEETRPDAKAGRGVVLLGYEARNQDLAPVMRALGTYLFQREPGA